MNVCINRELALAVQFLLKQKDTMRILIVLKLYIKSRKQSIK